MQTDLKNRAYAGFFVRFIAYVIDSMIAGIAVGIVKLPFAIAAEKVTFLNANFIFQFSFLDVLGYVGVVAYFVLLTYFAHRTLGKMLFRLEVVTENGEWTFLNILYRETIGRFLSGLFCIGYLAVLVTKKKQGFHDMLCDTYVVYSKMQLAMPLQENQPKQPVQVGNLEILDQMIQEKETQVQNSQEMTYHVMPQKEETLENLE